VSFTGPADGRRPWRVASITAVALLVALTFAFGADAGVTWDEPLQAEYGDRILRWFESGFADSGATHYLNLYLYGGLFEAVAQWVVRHSPVGLYETRHLLTAIMAVVGIICAGATASRISGPRAGVLAGALLALTPAWLGHGLFNSKDVPFGTCVAAATYCAVRVATVPVPVRWRDAIFAALSAGAALAVRAGGIFVLAYPFAATIAVVLQDLIKPVGRWADRRNAIAITVLRMGCALPLAWLLMLSAWPWAQLAPWSRPFEAIAAARRFPWDGEMLFAGRTIRATQLPANYLPTWFAITTPEFYGVAFALGAVAFTFGSLRRDRRFLLPTAILVLGLCGPIAGLAFTRPVLYDGLRHVLFLFPLLATLAGLSADAFLAAHRLPGAVRAAGAALLGISCAVTFVDIVALHPYEYAYFNRTFGGISAAVGRYETDYWGASYKEGLAWVVNDLPTINAGRPIRVASCNDNSNLRMEYYRRQWPGAAEKVVITREYRVADVYLAVTRYDCHKRPGDVLHVVSRQGAPLLYVIRTVSRS
jgi:hypothetical protein